jgi:hypothetical protein
MAEFTCPAERKPQEVNPPRVPGVAAIAVEIFDLKHKATAGHGVSLFVSPSGTAEIPSQPDQIRLRDPIPNSLLTNESRAQNFLYWRTVWKK